MKNNHFPFLLLFFHSSNGCGVERFNEIHLFPSRIRKNEETSDILTFRDSNANNKIKKMEKDTKQSDEVILNSNKSDGKIATAEHTTFFLVVINTMTFIFSFFFEEVFFSNTL